jgi:DNA-binding IclR family transcriptional regulator
MKTINFSDLYGSLMGPKANHPVRTTEKSLQLIEVLDEHGKAKIHELESDVEMTKGAIHNHLSTLREHGYVTKDGNAYKLSFKFFAIGGATRNRSELYQSGKRKINQLASETDFLTNLMVEEGGKGVYLYQARGDHAVPLDTHIGYQIHLHCTGIGKAILAHLPRERVNEIIDQWGLPKETENTITTADALFDELEDIRKQGYATDHAERTEGLTCIGAPVRVDEQLYGALSVSAPTKRLGNEEFEEQLIAEVEGTSNDISLNIKYG